MDFQPGKITKNHILEAAKTIDSGEYVISPSTGYDVIVNEKHYPPKEIMRFAHQIATGKHIWYPGGGEPTNKYLKALGFQIAIKSFSSNELAQLLWNRFNNIWRCADSWRWSEMKDSGLLTFAWLDNTADYKQLPGSSLKRGRRAIIPWVNELKIGDLIFVMGKNSFNGICIAESEYNFNSDKLNLSEYGEKPAIKVHYIFKADTPIPHTLETHNNPTTFAEIDKYKFGLENVLQFLHTQQPEVIKKLISYIDSIGSQIEKEDIMNNIPLNTILYGPPGTGKTYNTINKAIEIIDPEFYILNQSNRDDIKKRFDDLKKSGQIEFVTFHQSMSYEDFIEGIKPKTISGKVVYEYEDGVFKSFCNKARFVAGNFVEVIEKFKNDISEEDGKESIEIKTAGTTFDIVYRGTNVFYVQPHNSTKENPWYPVNIDNIRKAFETESFIGIYNSTYVREVINYLKKHYGLVKGNDQQNRKKQNYVFIIDEINRGNIAQIFGELITLIEENKRQNEPEELQSQLPYSKQSFSVPNNVYVIGTMNTADRSVEALDTALRRRFSFIEIPPNSDPIKDIKVGNIDIKLMLETINKRIEKLLNKDHLIGHAYFIDLNKSENQLSQLKHIFHNKIIPLLQEYFYGDSGKIGLVLGNGFVIKDKTENKKTFAAFNDYDDDSKSDLAERPVYSIIPQEKWTENSFVSIYPPITNETNTGI
jgi:flavodoxin